MAIQFKTFSALFFVPMFTFALAGCSGNASAPRAAHPISDQTAQHAQAAAWSLTLKSQCVGQIQDQCVARYGFIVDATGAYRVGPGPSGQLRTGSLSGAELSSIRLALEPAMTGLANVRAEGHLADVANTGDDTLTISRPGTTDLVLTRNVAGDFYYNTAAADQARSLHDTLRDIANGYYRLPFGDACGDAADKAMSAATALTTCQADSDCIYIDSYRDYAVVPPSSVQWLLSEDCTAVQPPVVANKLSIQGSEQRLSDLTAAARSTCGAEFDLSYFGPVCQYVQSSTANAPVCERGTCRARF